jgi:endoglucanase
VRWHATLPSRSRGRALEACAVLTGLALIVTGAATGLGGSRLTISVQGNQLVNAQGKPIRLLGVNRSGAEYPCIQRWGVFDGPTDPPAVAAMKAWGINAVRLPLNEDCWLGINGVSPEYGGALYRAAVVAFVTLLHRAGLYVILDLHWNAPGTQPSSAQAEMADIDHAPAFWSSVAQTFRTDPAVLFDLYNEPREIDWQCWRNGCTLPEGWATAGMQQLVDAVRATGAKQPIIATGLDWGTDVTGWLRYQPHDPLNQLVAGFHAFNFAHCSAIGCWRRTIGPVSRHVPVVTGELGENDCTSAFAERYMTWADKLGISYLGWTWNPSGCTAPALISSWDGTATPFGQGLRDHLVQLAQGSPRATIPESRLGPAGGR